MSAKQTEGKITALYERLSRDDEAVGDSNSIINQKRYLEDYAAQKGFTNCQHYTDDGISGGTFERPAWKRMLADIEAGKVGVVLAKDMSRIGRDYLQTGFYTEILFREKGVRFIAIGNGVDSADKNSSEFVPFLNIVNEWYLRDCSRKQMAAYQARGKAGKPTTNHAIYGYRKDPEDKHHWLVDEEAAAVVRRIFQLSVNGHGPYDIARILQREKVERPSCYLARHGCGSQKNIVDMARPYDWQSTTVSALLSRPEYMGHTVNFRTHKESYKDKRSVFIPPEDWLIFENTHEIEIAYLIQFEPLIRLEICENNGSWHSKSAESLIFCLFALSGERTLPHASEPSPLADLNPPLVLNTPAKAKSKSITREKLRRSNFPVCTVPDHPPCGDGSIDVKGREIRARKSVEIKGLPRGWTV